MLINDAYRRIEGFLLKEWCLLEAISRMALSNCIEFLQSYRHQIDHPAAHRMAASANAQSFIDTIVCINTYAVRIQMAWTHDDAFDVWCSTDTIELIFELVFELIFELILELILKLSWYRSSGWAVQLIIERKLWFQRNRNYQALWQFGEPSLTEFTLNFRAKCKCLEKNCEHFAGR